MLNHIIKIGYVISLIVILISCEKIPVYTQKEYNLENGFEDIMIYETDDLLHEKMEMILEGYLDGMGKIFFFHQPYPSDTDEYIFLGGAVIQGDIKMEIKKAWYEDEVLIKYLPIDTCSGKLLIKFRVF